jgi:hypothetical protein
VEGTGASFGSGLGGMRNIIILGVVIVLSCWAVIQLTVLSNHTQPDPYSGTGSLDHAESEKYLQTLLHQASSMLSKMSELNLTNSNYPSLPSLPHSSTTHSGEDLKHSHVAEKYIELRHAFDQCEVQKLEAMAEAHKYKSTHSSSPVETKHQSSVAMTHSKPDKWLVIGIPTVQRANNEDYLLKTLRAMSNQLPISPSDLLYGKILISIVNVQDNPSTHSRYFEAKKELSGPHNPRSIYFEFHDSVEPDVNPMPGSKDQGSPNKPGARVRRQTRDIAKVVKMSVNKAQYYLFSEDDMVLCPSGLTTMQYMLSKASMYHPDWLAIRASYGMNGIVMHNKDLEEFSDYMIQNQKRRPPDHLVVEWYAGETPRSKAYKQNRANIGFRYNIFNHLGVVSTLRSTNSPGYLTCYQELLEPTVFQVEAFSKMQCPGDDIWPCDHIDMSSQSHLKLSSLVESPQGTDASSNPVIPKGKGRQRKKKRNGRQYRRR